MAVRGAQRGISGRSLRLFVGPLTVASFVGALAVSCGSSDYGDSLDGATSQFSFERDLVVPRAVVSLLVVDDGADAAELRASLVIAITNEANRKRASGSRCGALVDPAAWSPLDWSVVVVHPSATGDALIRSPADDARLRWTENIPSAEGAKAFVAAVTAALEPVASGPVFAPLAALKDVGSLLAGQRAAATERETALLAALPAAGERVLKPLLVLAHDDASPSEPSENVLAAHEDVEFASAVVPAREARAAEACLFERSASTARLDSWLGAQQLEKWATWPCDGLPFEPFVSDAACAPECRRFLPLETADGSAACLILVETDATSCDPSLGWFDPEADDGVRRPRTVTSAGKARRVCEIRQLSGAALTSCRDSRDCEDCEPGWCLTDVTEIVRPCAFDRSLPLRYVGGADLAAPGKATITCNFQRESP